MGIRALEICGEGDAHAFIVRVFGDALGFDCVGVEGEAVRFHIACRKFFENANKAIGSVVPAREKVGIAGRPIAFVSPKLEEQSTFEDKDIAIGRAAEAVEDSLQTVLDEDQPEIIFARTGEVEKFLPHGGGQVFRRWSTRATPDKDA